MGMPTVPNNTKMTRKKKKKKPKKKKKKKKQKKKKKKKKKTKKKKNGTNCKRRYESFETKKVIRVCQGINTNKKVQPIADRGAQNLEIVSKQIEQTRILPMGFTISTK